MSGIKFDINIYMDTLGLLLGEKTDIRDEILQQLNQGDCILDDIREEILEYSEENKFDENKILNIYDGMSCKDMMEFITFSESGITFDYGESYECHDRRCAAFRVPCTFDVKKFIENIKSETS